jgi:hypothetical protein
LQQFDDQSACASDLVSADIESKNRPSLVHLQVELLERARMDTNQKQNLMLCERVLELYAAIEAAIERGGNP